MTALIYPLIFVAGGVLFIVLGGKRAWQADEVGDANKYLRVSAFGGGLFVIGLVGLLIVQLFFKGGDKPQPIPDDKKFPAISETVTETGVVAVKTATGEVATETGAAVAKRTGSSGETALWQAINGAFGFVLGGTGEEATGTGETVVGSGEIAIGTGSIIDNKKTSTGTAVNTEITIITDSQNEPHRAARLEELMRERKAESEAIGEEDIPHLGTINFLGASYSVNGEPVKNLYAGEEFRLNIKVQGGDFFVWDIDTSTDNDNDGVSNNDYDIIAEDPLLIYNTPGKYQLNLTVANADTISNRTYSVTIEEKAPDVDIKVLADEQYPAKIYLDATGTKFYSAGAREFTWKVDGRIIRLEEVVDEPGENAAGWYTLPTTGTYEIECQVIARMSPDSSNNRSGENYYRGAEIIEYTLDSMLAAEISSDDGIKIAPAKFTFVAKAGDFSSTGLDESVVQDYRWDFGDGTPIINGKTEREIEHIFRKPGIYEVNLTVVDDRNESAEASLRVFISDSGAPVAYFDIDPESAGYRGQVFGFDASPSLRADGGDEGLSFTWDFGDGSVLTRGRRSTHRFLDTGMYEVTLSVTDDSGGPYNGFYESYTREIIIEPTAPIADFWVNDTGGLEIEFDASATTDDDNNIVKYQWDFGDGTNALTERPTVRHVYDEAGKYDVYMMVKDADGRSAETTKTVEIK